MNFFGAPFMQLDMNSLFLGLGSGLLLGIVVMAGYAASVAGSLSRAKWGLKVAGRAGKDSALSAKIDAALGTATLATAPTVAAPAKPSGESLRLLAILQTEARLVDFLMEDLTAASDVQIGQGVRDVQKKAANSLKKHLVLEPILAGTEGDRVTVPKGFDPSAISVLGHVTGEPPFSGELQHPGWKVKEFKLPSGTDGRDLFVIQPAEVQM
jgi:hypothetical protein